MLIILQESNQLNTIYIDMVFIKNFRDKFVDSLDVEILLNDMIKRINSFFYKASIEFKVLDSGIDFARLIREPTAVQIEKVAFDFVYLYGIVTGVNSYCVIFGTADIAYQVSLGKYQKAFEVVVDMVNVMALPYILLRANRPYLGFAYGTLVAMSTVYDAINNAY